MEWTDANEVTYAGKTIIPTQTTDTTGGAFPRGSVRWKNLGTENGEAFDLIVTVSEEPAYYSELLDIEYHSPTTTSASQALMTSSGFACLGLGLRTSYCWSGSALDGATAQCADGTPTTMRGSEFNFRFVYAGSTESVPAFERMYATFYDVDGDVERGSSVRELVSVLGATSRIVAPMTTLEADVFLPSEAQFAIATTSVNVPTDFNTDPASPLAESMSAIVSFEITGASTFRVMLGGLSAKTGQSNRGYCFAMVRPDIGVGCPQQQSPPSPSPPPPSPAPR